MEILPGTVLIRHFSEISYISVCIGMYHVCVCVAAFISVENTHTHICVYAIHKCVLNMKQVRT